MEFYHLFLKWLVRPDEDQQAELLAGKPDSLSSVFAPHMIGENCFSHQVTLASASVICHARTHKISNEKLKCFKNALIEFLRIFVSLVRM